MPAILFCLDHTLFTTRGVKNAQLHTETESENFLYQDIGLSQISKLINCTSEKIINNENGVV